MTGRHILVVDDSTDSRALLAATLAADGHRVSVAANGVQALKILNESTPELVVLDFNMPGLDGLETLKLVRQREQYVAVVFVTARSEKPDVVRGLDAGADDYICKPFDPEELQARVRVQLRIKDLHDRLADANRRLQEQVEIDDLTQLYNMRSMYARIDNALKRARRYKRTVGVVMIDLDHFKNVNDAHDHLFGSYVLAQLGAVIRGNVRETDLAARYGGDEFLVVLTETNAEGAAFFAERLRSVIESQECVSGEHRARVTASVGLALSDMSPDADARDLVRLADQALYEAKRQGRNRVVRWQPAPG
ncbi:MAG: diguanylate cyclase [Myxococcota bacterium]